MVNHGQTIMSPCHHLPGRLELDGLFIVAPGFPVRAGGSINVSSDHIRLGDIAMELDYPGVISKGARIVSSLEISVGPQEKRFHIARLVLDQEIEILCSLAIPAELHIELATIFMTGFGAGIGLDRPVEEFQGLVIVARPLPSRL